MKDFWIVVILSSCAFGQETRREIVIASSAPPGPLEWR